MLALLTYFSLNSATPGRVYESHSQQPFTTMQRAYTHLALEEFQTSTSTSADMAELVLSSILSNNRGGIAATDDNGSTLASSLDGSIKKRL